MKLYGVLESLVICFLWVLSFIECAPIENENIEKPFIQFYDDWNYKTVSHSSPLLKNSTRVHVLPVLLNFEKDLNIESLLPSTTSVQDRTAKKLTDLFRSKVNCGVCKLGVGLLYNLVLTQTPFEQIKEKFVNLCVSFNIQNVIVCTGLFEVYGPEIIPALNVTTIGPPEICNMLIGETCGELSNPIHEWNIHFPSDKPKPDVVDLPLQSNGLPTFKVLHISDTHFDPEYAPGSPSNCQEPLCCRTYSTPMPGETIVPAGIWGSYQKCDTPKILLENMLQNIAKTHPDIDYIIWTGDLPPHDIWNQTKESNIEIIQESVNMMYDYFPNTPIFAAVGNHESIPAGNFPPPWVKHENHSIGWLYEELANGWRKWLPEQLSDTILHGAFYSVLLRPGFRIIALNTNYCHNLNWWLYVNSTDPSHELKWLVNELQKAEDNGEKVHILGHIPPGASDCMKQWSSVFYDIVFRYESTITGQFYGHSHADEFEIFYETSEYSRPTNVAYLGPSITTYEDFNPAYRIYYVDGDHGNTTREVLDHETWIIDLEEANKVDKPTWFRLYSARDAFRMKSLRPSDWNELLYRMIDNEEDFETFYSLYYRGNPKRPFCDNKCRLQVLCDLKSGKSQSRKQLCHDILEYDKYHS